jgi:SlyX protein
MTDKSTDARLTALEIKASFAEDTLDRLDEIIIRQQRLIDALIREILLLRQHAQDGGQTGPSAPRDELPPHY